MNFWRFKIKTVTVHYFAILRDQRGLENESLKVESATYADLYEQLRQRHGFTLPPEMIQVAVNDQYVQMHSAITEGAKVVFLPPVAGG
jgi:sulfur-carrier protein